MSENTDQEKKAAEERTARSLAVVEDCARLRKRPARPMTLQQALDLDEWIRRTPDAVVLPKSMREAVRVLADAYRSSIGAHP